MWPGLSEIQFKQFNFIRCLGEQFSQDGWGWGYLALNTKFRDTYDCICFYKNYIYFLLIFHEGSQRGHKTYFNPL